MTIAAVSCGVFTLFVWLGGRNRRWEPTPVDVTGPIWLLALATSAMFGLDPGASVPRLGKGLFPALLPLAAYHAGDPGRGRRAVATLLCSSAIASLYGIVFFVARGASFSARARGFVGHYMTFAGQLLLLVSLASGIALMARTRHWRIGAILVAGIGAIALGGTFTRSAWIGLTASLLLMCAIARRGWLPLLAGAIVLLVLVAPSAYRERLASAFDPHHPVNRERTFMWKAGLDMFRDHPIAGVGLEDLHPIYDRYRSPDSHERAGHLHSVWIQIAASMGVIGLVAFLLLYGSLVRATAQGLFAMIRAPGLAGGVRLGALGGLAGFLMAGSFEWNFGDEELLFLLYVIAGIAWAARNWPADIETT